MWDKGKHVDFFLTDKTEFHNNYLALKKTIFSWEHLLTYQPKRPHILRQMLWVAYTAEALGSWIQSDLWHVFMFAHFLCFLVYRPSSGSVPPSKKPYQLHEWLVFSDVNTEFEEFRTPLSWKLLKKANLNIIFIDWWLNLTFPKNFQEIDMRSVWVSPDPHVLLLLQLDWVYCSSLVAL